MRKGFISTILLLAGAVFVLASSAYLSYKSNLEFEKQKFGATILTTDLTNTIGTFRTNVNTSLQNLNDQLTASTTTDPGHTHTTAGISGTIAVAKGGTATNTFTYGFVIASSTNAFTTLGPTVSGQLPISNGTLWTTGYLTAGNGMTITTSSGAITLAANGFILLDATSTAVTTSGTTTSTLFSIIVPSSTLVGQNAIKVRVNFGNVQAGAAGDITYFTLSFGGNPVVRQQFTAGTADRYRGHMNIVIAGAASTTSQYASITSDFTNTAAMASVSGTVIIGGAVSKILAFTTGTVAVSTSATSSQTLLFQVQHNLSTAGLGETMDSYLAEKILNQ